ncbi:hypothetical protein [Pandoraea sp. NPDC087047]|uniref:endonuclease III domain-containing protein n=1 Tax=Pandoraea sp. NPDC087047 TaxID=3364390 RepID=UPI0037FFD973
MATRTATAKPDGKTAAGKTPAKTVKTTAKADPVRKSAQPGAAKTAKASRATKTEQAAPKVVQKVASKVAKKAAPKPGVKAPSKTAVRPDAPSRANAALNTASNTATNTVSNTVSTAASNAATTRRVIAKRDGETRIVTPEIERIEHEIVEQAVTGVVPLPVAPGSSRPDFWDQACADLMKRDRILKKLIPQFGPAHLTGRGEPFVTLARSIVGQQISVKAAQAVWDRVVAICPKLSPSQFIKAGHDALAGCGLSRRKAEYILDLATHFKSGALHVDAWASMDDEAVIAELTGIRGIGRWTAEMFLMFNLLRPDVLPLDDVGLINAISVNYFSGEPVTRSEAREVAANWEPWRSVATWYMWRSLEPVAVEY